MPAGEDQAWKALLGLDPQDVCSRAKVAYDRSCHAYIVKSFSQDIFVCPQDIAMYRQSPAGGGPKEINSHSRLPVLSYLIHAKDIPLADELVSPVNLPGGDIYVKGVHALPLDKVAEKYGGDVRGFVERGRSLSGEGLSYGDASFRLHPLPRVPVALILWKAVEEFPARANLLFDSTCQLHLPPDVIWATAMMVVRHLLQD